MSIGGIGSVPGLAGRLGEAAAAGSRPAAGSGAVGTGAVGTGAVGTGAVGAGAGAAGSGAAGAQFGEFLQKALADVNRLQLEADDAARSLAAGTATDLHTVAIIAEKADLALQLTLQVRNRILEAYQEIMRMQV
jgi:flagellar hook-basal body complex protein FliE